MAAERGDVVSQVFCDVLERFAFMFGEPAEKTGFPAPGPGCIAAVIRFFGEQSGSMTVAVTGDTCAEIAANVLGIDPDDERVADSGADALKEVLNVACGHILTELAGDKPVFDISIPETVALDGLGWTSMLASDDTVALLVDGAPILVRFSIQ
jgi:CheY-specific phosphatase CheX